MGTVNGLTAEQMLVIQNSSVVDGSVDANGDLILTKYDGTTINAGNVIGPQGPQGNATGPAGGVLSGTYPNPAFASNVFPLPLGGAIHQFLRKNSAADGDATWQDLVQVTSLPVIASGATGSFSLFTLGKLAILQGYCDWDTLNTGTNAGTFNDTGAVIPTQYVPSSSFVTAPAAPYGTTGIQYRYRLNTINTTDGKILVQRSGLDTTFMAINAVVWVIPQ